MVWGNSNCCEANPEVEKLFYGVSNLQAYLIENILGKGVIEDKIGIET